jgi:hypothetical protein
MYLYRVHTKTVCDSDNEWLQEFRQRHMCNDCRQISARICNRPIDVWIEHHPGPAALNSVNPPHIGIARRDFLDLFSEEINQYLHLGKVFLSNGKKLEDYVTFVSDKRLLIRGGKDPSYRTCNMCKGFIYWPGWSDWYVVRSSLTGRKLYEAGGFGGLLVTEELRKRIKKGVWKGIEIIKIPVVDEARDGIETIPDNITI